MRHETVSLCNAAASLSRAGAAFDHIDDADVADWLAFTSAYSRHALKDLERAATVVRRSAPTAGM